MANVMDLMATLGLDASKFEEGLNKAKQLGDSFGEKMQGASGKLQELGKGMEKTGSYITKVGKAFAPMSTAAGAGLGMAIKTAASFEAQMSKVQAISGVTGSEFAQLTAKAREMGAKTKFSASEAGEAMEYMAMAGWKAGEMLDGVEGIMNLAAAAGEDLGTTSDIVTDALTGFGLTAADSGHFADVLAAASSNANTNVSMMGETFKFAAPLAGALGFSIEDVAVATGLMANSGIKASMAGTALRGWMTRLAKPTKQSAQAMKDLGLSLTDSEGNMKSFMQIMEETRDAFSGLTEAEKAQYAAMLVGQGGMSGLLAVVNATEADFKKLTRAVDNADGTALKMAETMQNNLNGQLTILKSGVEEAAISVGNALLPNIKDLVSKVQDAVNWFNSLDSATQSSIAQMLVLAAGIAPVTIALGSMISSIGTIVGALGMLLTPAGLVVAALAAITIGVQAFKAGIDTSNPQIDAFREKVSMMAKNVEENRASIEGLATSMKKVSDELSTTGAPLTFWRDELHKCFTATGELKEGCEELAWHAIDELNGAMQTDYSLQFITQAQDSAAALREIDAAIDEHIEKLKYQAIQQATMSDYTEALKNQAAAHTEVINAEGRHKQAAEELGKAMAEAHELANANPLTTPNWHAQMEQANAKVNQLKDAVNEAGDAMVTAKGNVAAADATVKGLETTMEELAKNGVEGAEKTAESYVKVGESAEQARQTAEKSAKETRENIEKTFEPPLPGIKINNEESIGHAVETKDGMQKQFTDNPFKSTVDKVEGGEAAATAAHGEMQNVIGKSMQGNVGSVTGASAAASSAHSEMQSFFNAHPIIAKVVKSMSDDGSSESYGGRSQKANGGFVYSEKDVTVGEAGPEVIIPLSSTRRRRAINLFANTAERLGVATGANGGGGGNSIVVNAPINVYASEGQSAVEVARVVSDTINRQIMNNRRVWEGAPT